jgi:hypothetical protein
MSHVDLSDIEYLGADIVPEVIEELQRRYAGPGRRFVCLDAVSDPLPKADAVLCRAFFIHLPNALVRRVLANIKASGARWLLASTMPSVMENVELKVTGSFRPLNLEIAPFNFSPPIARIEEPGKYVGVYEVARLP